MKIKSTLLTLSVALSIPLSSWAQRVPAIENVTYMPGSYAPVKKPILETMAQPKPQVLPEETEGSQIQKKPVSGATIGEDGSLIYNYGSNLPSIICAPLHVCEVSLQAGETIQQIDVGDPIRWQVKLARGNRNGIETSHLIIKPTETGIASNLIAITDKRTYSMRLLSRQDKAWMPKVAFSYPDDIQANWQAYFAQNKTQERTVNLASNAAMPASGPTLDFHYHLKGDKPAWRPIRIYTDQVKTYIQFPATAQNDEIPVLLLLGPGSTEQLVNYRLEGNAFVVDKVIQRAALISGVGKHQERVDIQREGS
jgi:type IV secretion system protein TrbG